LFRTTHKHLNGEKVTLGLGSVFTAEKSVSLNNTETKVKKRMTQLETLSSLQGRTLLRDIYSELRNERQLTGMSALTLCWRMCTTERELFKLSRREVVILHPLGIWAGTSLWMQEIVNRYYYTTINAFVYAGAALLLLAVGLNRTQVVTSPGIVIGGVILEAVLLMVLFVVMYFTPTDELELAGGASQQNSATDDLLRELGEIGRDYAAMAVQLESISSSLTDLVEKQDQIVSSMKSSVQAAIDAVAPNPALMASMASTTDSLLRFSQGIDALEVRLRVNEKEEVERIVRTELERILSANLLRNNDPNSQTP